jgi:hypothetical protein
MQTRVQQLQLRIRAGVQRGTISRSEAVRLDAQLRQVTRLEMQYGRNGINGRERSDLQLRVDSLREQVRQAERMSNGRYDRGDRYSDGRYDDDDRYTDDDRYDRNNDGWDDRDGDRDGRWDVEAGNDDNRDGWDDRDTDRDGSWADNGDDVDDGLLDDENRRRDEDDYGQTLRVGERAPADLGVLPPEYRDNYRDGNGVYYRYGNGNVYEVDARTNLILRSFPDRR